MAKHVESSRAQLDRLLDPNNSLVTLHTLQRTAAVRGKRLQLELGVMGAMHPAGRFRCVGGLWARCRAVPRRSGGDAEHPRRTKARCTGRSLAGAART